MAVQKAPFNTLTSYSRVQQLARIQLELQLALSGIATASAAVDSGSSSSSSGSSSGRPAEGAAATTSGAAPPASFQHQRLDSYESVEAAVGDSVRLAGGWAPMGVGVRTPEGGDWG